MPVASENKIENNRIKENLNLPDLEWVCVLHGVAHGQGHGDVGLDAEGVAHEERHEEGGEDVEDVEDVGDVEGVEGVENVEGVEGEDPAVSVAHVEGAAGVAEEEDQCVGAVDGAVGAWVGVGGGQVAGDAGGMADEVTVEDEGVEVGVVNDEDEVCVGRGVAVEEGGHVDTEAGPGQ